MDKHKDIKSATVSGFLWRLLQNAGTQVVSFVISIVLARLLLPDDYGLVAMVNVLTSIAMVFVNTGFSSAIIQKKDITEEEISAAFFCGILVALVLYGVVFLCAPLVSQFYGDHRLTLILRVQAISIILASLYSVQQALIARTMQFKKGFVMNLSGAVVQGIVGIVLALQGYGVWALLIGALVNNLVCCIVVSALVRFRPRWTMSMNLIKPLLPFSLKVLLANLLDTLFNNIRSLLIGKVYSTEDLAFYNRGYQFPTLVMVQVDGAMNTVLFSALSKFQDDWELGLRVLRRSMRASLFVCVPLMAGMFAVAESMVLVLLTDKWAESIPYVRLVCLLCVTWPLSAKKHALIARGESGAALKLNILDKIIVVAFLLVSYRRSVFAMVLSSVLAAIPLNVIAFYVYKKYLNYSIKDQLMDILPSFAISVVMGGVVMSMTCLPVDQLPLLILQIVTGIVLYVGLSWLFNREPLLYCANIIKPFLMRISGKK